MNATEVWLGYKTTGGGLEIDPSEINNIAIIGSDDEGLLTALDELQLTVDEKPRIRIVKLEGLKERGVT